MVFIKIDILKIILAVENSVLSRNVSKFPDKIPKYQAVIDITINLPDSNENFEGFLKIFIEVIIFIIATSFVGNSS